MSQWMKFSLAIDPPPSIILPKLRKRPNLVGEVLSWLPQSNRLNSVHFILLDELRYPIICLYTKSLKDSLTEHQTWDVDFPSWLLRKTKVWLHRNKIGEFFLMGHWLALVSTSVGKELFAHLCLFVCHLWVDDNVTAGDPVGRCADAIMFS